VSEAAWVSQRGNSRLARGRRRGAAVWASSAAEVVVDRNTMIANSVA